MEIIQYISSITNKYVIQYFCHNYIQIGTISAAIKLLIHSHKIKHVYLMSSYSPIIPYLVCTPIN